MLAQLLVQNGEVGQRQLASPGIPRLLFVATKPRKGGLIPFECLYVLALVKEEIAEIVDAAKLRSHRADFVRQRDRSFEVGPRGGIVALIQRSDADVILRIAQPPAIVAFLKQLCRGSALLHGHGIITALHRLFDGLQKRLRLRLGLQGEGE